MFRRADLLFIDENNKNRKLFFSIAAYFQYQELIELKKISPQLKHFIEDDQNKFLLNKVIADFEILRKMTAMMMNDLSHFFRDLRAPVGVLGLKKTIFKAYLAAQNEKSFVSYFTKLASKTPQEQKDFLEEKHVALNAKEEFDKFYYALKDSAKLIKADVTDSLLAGFRRPGFLGYLFYDRQLHGYIEPELLQRCIKTQQRRWRRSFVPMASIAILSALYVAGYTGYDIISDAIMGRRPHTQARIVASYFFLTSAILIIMFCPMSCFWLGGLAREMDGVVKTYFPLMRYWDDRNDAAVIKACLKMIRNFRQTHGFYDKDEREEEVQQLQIIYDEKLAVVPNVTPRLRLFTLPKIRENKLSLSDSEEKENSDVENPYQLLSDGETKGAFSISFFSDKQDRAERKPIRQYRCCKCVIL